MLTITTQPKRLNEKQYSFDFIFNKLLGIPYQLVLSDNHDSTRISDGRNTLCVIDTFFLLDEEDWLQATSLPISPLQSLKISELGLSETLASNTLPIIYTNSTHPSGVRQLDKNTIQINIDIFGSCFFMLSGYEDIVIRNKDTHGRTITEDTLAYKNNFLHRPIVNEYCEVLWRFLKQLFPALQRKKHAFKLRPTHDIDTPFLYTFSSVSRLAKEMGKQVLHQKSIRQCIRQPHLFIRSKLINSKHDPYNTFDYLMQQSDALNVKSIFYFMTDFTNLKYEKPYPIQHPQLQNIIQSITKKRHIIGLHASYESINENKDLQLEVMNLLKACQIDQENLGSRQHYLRWDTHSMPGRLERAHIFHDSTLTPTAHVGFKNGTCHPFLLYDFQNNRPSRVIEYPLHVMDVNLFAKSYLNLSPEDAFDLSTKIKSACQKFDGIFTLLWHNSSLVTDAAKDFYSQLLSY